MAFTDGSKRHDESHCAYRHVRLVGLQDGTGIEQCGSLARIFLREIGSDQQPLPVVYLRADAKLRGQLLVAPHQQPLDLVVAIV
ncbi:hypothetical protein [Sphingomonas sp. 22R3R2A-7]|uniref:hypothetical protein n=1 Tax=Sphingomonas sp. 22R3R2A-7 TaxID=3050230 RepID=UPI003FA77AA5